MFCLAAFFSLNRSSAGLRKRVNRNLLLVAGCTLHEQTYGRPQ